MKKVLFPIFALLMASLTFAQQQDSTAVALAAPTIKIGYIDREVVVSSLDAVKEARQKISQLKNDYEAEFASMTKNYNQKVKQYLETKNSIPEAVKLARQTEITEMESMISLFKQRYSADIEARTKELVAPHYKSVDDAIAAVAKIMNITIVFDAGQPLYVSDICIDMTQYVNELLKQ